jgi:hypothetical protein
MADFALYSHLIRRLVTQLVKHAPPQQLPLRETPKDSVILSLLFAIYGKDVIAWRTF